MTFGAPLTEPLEMAVEAEFAAGAPFPDLSSAAALRLRFRRDLAACLALGGGGRLLSTRLWPPSAARLAETVAAVLTCGRCVHTWLHVPAPPGDRRCEHAGKAQADAAAGCEVKVFVFSTLEDVDRRSQVSIIAGCRLAAMHGVSSAMH